jgi:hypothetical protein
MNKFLEHQFFKKKLSQSIADGCALSAIQWQILRFSIASFTSLMLTKSINK